MNKEKVLFECREYMADPFEVEAMKKMVEWLNRDPPSGMGKILLRFLTKAENGEFK